MHDFFQNYSKIFLRFHFRGFQLKKENSDSVYKTLSFQFEKSISDTQHIISHHESMHCNLLSVMRANSEMIGILHRYPANTEFLSKLDD